MAAHVPVLKAAWKAGLQSARANLAPGLALQAFALALLLAYYGHPPTQDALARLSALRTETGAVFGIVSTGLFGGLLPFLYLKSMPSSRARYTWAQGAVLTAFWAYKGFEIGLWYDLMARFVGTAGTPGTVALKAVLDQLVYCPIFAIPVTVLVYAYCETRFNLREVATDVLRPGWYLRRVLPTLLANLGVWLPVVCIIYSLPTPLQLPLQNIVLCFFTLMLAHLAQRRLPAKG